MSPTSSPTTKKSGSQKAYAPYRYGLSVVAQDITQMADYCRHVEKAGFWAMGFGDSQCVRPDMIVEETICALTTERVHMGPRVTNPVTRHLSTLANAMASLNTLSGGRAFLGIGAGDSAVYQVGLRPARLAVFEEALVALRNLMSGQPAKFDGKTFHLEWPVTPCPIWVAATGPKTLEMAGRLGDGVMLSNGLDQLVVEESLTHIERGARQSGRSLDDIELWWSVGVGIGEPEEITPTLAGMAAAYSNQAFRFTHNSKAVPNHLKEKFGELEKAYNFYNHMTTESKGHNAELIRSLGLLDYLMDRFIVFGSPEQCVEKIKRVRGYGATNLFLTMPLPEKHPFLDAWEQGVGPHL